MAGPAPTLRELLKQANELWPSRSRASDGIMGDPAHQARKSDHNSGNAVDITHDPSHGVNCEQIAAHLTASGDDRIKYIIWNRRIWYPKSGARPQGWSKYTGTNPHTKHLHLSIHADDRNDLRPWVLDKPQQKGYPVLRLGAKGETVSLLQTLLNKDIPKKLKIDGDFGEATEGAVKLYQRTFGLTPDGIVEDKTWQELLS